MIKVLKEEFDHWSLRDLNREVYETYEKLDNLIGRFSIENMSELDKEKIDELIKKTNEFIDQAEYAMTAMRKNIKKGR